METVNTPENTSSSRSVSDRLREIDLVVETSPDSARMGVEGDLESHQDSQRDKITTADEYLQKELDYRLTKFLLARYFTEEHRPHDNTGGQTEIAYRQIAADRPEWEDHFPRDDSAEEASRWEAFKSGYVEHMQVLLDGLYRDGLLLADSQKDAALMKDVEAEKSNNFEAKQSAILSRAIRHKVKPLEQENRDTVNRSASHEVSLTAAEQEKIRGNEQMAGRLQSLEAEALARLDEEQLRIALDTLVRLDILHDRAAIRRGLLLTEQMQEVVDRRLAGLVGGGRLLLVGETGGAKTALAKHLAREVLRLKGDHGEGRLVSGYGDLNAYQIIGKMELGVDEETKQTITKFSLGAITRAMVDGSPLIIDEVNAIDATILKRLNEILFLKPGDPYRIQENGGQEITVADGFCIIMTANEKSARYRGVGDISTELENRMAVYKENISYPDSDVLIGETPPDLLRLAMAASVDRWGNIALERMGIDAAQFVSLVRTAHKTQRMFSESAQALNSRSGLLATYASDAQLRDGGKPVLQNFVIAPRTLVEIISELSNSGGQLRLEDLLTSMLNGIKDDNDRAVVREIFKSESLLSVS